MKNSFRLRALYELFVPGSCYFSPREQLNWRYLIIVYRFSRLTSGVSMDHALYAILHKTLHHSNKESRFNVQVSLLLCHLLSTFLSLFIILKG